MKNSGANMRTRSAEQFDEYYKSMDAVYKLFLDHLRSDGTSYILEMGAREFGVPVYLKYGGQKTSSYDRPKTKHHNNKAFSSKQIIPKTKSMKETRRNECDNNASMIEESYERFLNHLKFDEGLMVLELEGGHRVVYEEDRKNRSENVMVGNGVGSDNHASGSNGETDGLAVISADSRSFDEKLAEVLSEPYDHREYEALMNEAIRRKPVMRQRVLRNMSKRYRTHEAGSSYLDYYPDLATQIAEATKYDRLILLRKFFFWLENLCHDGAYQPWVPKALTNKPIFDEEVEN